MNLFLPQNIFSKFYEKLIDKKNIDQIIYLPSSQLSNAIENDQNSFGLIPSCDLITHKDFYISTKLGIAFDGLISSSYFYFGNNFGNNSKVHVYGDISSNDLILSKILLSERYDIDIDLVIDTQKRNSEIENYLISGEENLLNNLFEKGISFADQVAEFINYPYVNYVTASKNENIIKEINPNSENIDTKLEEEINNFLVLENLSDSVKDFISMNIGSLYYELTENEINALQELIRLPYYHGMIEEIYDLKLV